MSAQLVNLSNCHRALENFLTCEEEQVGRGNMLLAWSISKGCTSGTFDHDPCLLLAETLEGAWGVYFVFPVHRDRSSRKVLDISIVDLHRLDIDCLPMDGWLRRVSTSAVFNEAIPGLRFGAPEIYLAQWSSDDGKSRISGPKIVDLAGRGSFADLNSKAEDFLTAC